jgi:molybdopterin-guanine dinucleotide biosynthesis protein A
LPFIERQLATGNLSVLDLYPLVRTTTVSAGDVAQHDPSYRSFVNLNTPEEYEKLLTDACQG